LHTGKSNNVKARSVAPRAHGGNGAYFYQEYPNGDVCDHEDVTDSAIKAGEVGEGRVERSTTVRYGCGGSIGLIVKEDTSCHYVADVTIPALCQHPFFRAPVSKKQVVKCIPEFAAFCAKHQTTLAVLTAAYNAAQEEASQALLEQRCPALVCARKLSMKRDRYQVAAGPLGYSCTPSTEQVSSSCIACGGHTLELNLYNLDSFIDRQRQTD
jgi:hypothetical protein